MLKFVEWTRRSPSEATTKRSLHYLERRIGVTRKTIGKWFPEDQCADNPWHALCYTAVEALKVYDAPEAPAPEFIKACSDTYARWRNDDEMRTERHAVSTDLLGMTDVALREIALEQQDLSLVTEAARILIERFHRKLLTTSLLTAQEQSRREALEAANSIVAIARPVVHRVWNARARATLETKQNCVNIVDAAVDAYRLRSRDLGQEAVQMSALLDLRNKDLDITGDIRPKSQAALNEYYRDTAWAYLSDSEGEKVEGEIAATEHFLDVMTGLGVKIYSGDTPVGRRRQHNLEADQMVHVVTQIAYHLVTQQDNDVPSGRSTECAARLLAMYSPSAGPDRRDVATLFAAARGHAPVRVKPLDALKIVKFRGVGEVLMARFLADIAFAEFADDAVPDDVSPYLGAPVEAERRTLALHRSVGLYQRAIAWLRNGGAAGALRQLAIQELDNVSAKLLAGPHETHPPARDIASIVRKIEELRASLDAMIGEGFLSVHLNSWAELQDRSGGSPLTGVAEVGRVRRRNAKIEAAELMQAYMEVWRYLKKPELGLRTDLPPLGEPGLSSIAP